MPKNPKISVTQTAKLQQAGLPTNLSMDEMVQQSSFTYVTNNLRLQNTDTGYVWYFDPKVTYSSPEDAVAEYWASTKA